MAILDVLHQLYLIRAVLWSLLTGDGIYVVTVQPCQAIVYVVRRSAGADPADCRCD